MPKYTVEIKEVHHNILEVEAPEGTSFTELTELADKALANGDGYVEYGHTMDRSDWIVRDSDKKIVVPD